MLQHYIGAACIALALSGCSLIFNEPLPPGQQVTKPPTTKVDTSHQEEPIVVSTEPQSEEEYPDVPYELYYHASGLYKIKAYIGYDWKSVTGRNSFWPRTDGDLTKKGSLIIFPQQGGVVLFEIVNNYADFSLYITNYNKHISSEVYYFDESGGYPGVSSFSEYGYYYHSVTYRLVVKPNQTGKTINFCQAHWASNKDRAYLSDFQIQCRIIADGTIQQITILDIN